MPHMLRDPKRYPDPAAGPSHVNTPRMQFELGRDLYRRLGRDGGFQACWVQEKTAPRGETRIDGARELAMLRG
jgi:hypothetical protein